MSENWDLANWDVGEMGLGKLDFGDVRRHDSNSSVTLHLYFVYLYINIERETNDKHIATIFRRKLLYHIWLKCRLKKR